MDQFKLNGSAAKAREQLDSEQTGRVKSFKRDDKDTFSEKWKCINIIHLEML